ncbi:hypothetical protein [Acinetobacter baumannii]|uniref:hypothetical protein n=1 Tax=Acinetobacter baumannii TaxID=470 RepID=UPI0002CF7A10|nr:hypothetical protein [Acinetobacter baumannii]ENU70085.1 hypothetical protein F978_01516 [Acinetobacter baumannii NIPH 615]MCR8954594.1 hypothetical protein [Acinetobacter baumannii]
MYNEKFEKQHKDYFDDFGERGYTLAWLYIDVIRTKSDVEIALQTYQTINTPEGRLLPNSDTIKNEVIQYIQNQPHPEQTLELLHLFIKNMLIESDFFKSIDSNNCALISYLIINILREQNPQQDNIYLPERYIHKPPVNLDIQFINIPESEKYGNLNKDSRYIGPHNKNIQIPIFNQKLKIKQTEDLFSIFIHLIDQYQSTLESKKEYISNLLNSFNGIKNNKNTYKWIDPDNTDQIEWILNYLTTTLRTKVIVGPSHYINVILRQCTKYETIFLLLAERPIQDKELTILKLKKAWSQQKFRLSGKAKKAHHLPLTKDTTKKLKALSEVMAMTESQILENLIGEKYRLTILDENGRPKY